MKIIILLAVIIPLFILLPGCSKEADNSNGNKIIAMTIYPDHIFADNNEATYSEVSVTIETWDGAPAQGVEVSFEADSGSIQDIVYTDENGIALNVFNDDGIPGTAYICANISSDQPECRTIEIRADPHLTIAWIMALPDTIYPEYGITSSEIEVSVKDQSGFPIPDEHVYFDTDIGSIITNVTTDSSGLANTVFSAAGIAGTAHINAFVGFAEASVTVVIAPYPQVTDLSLEIGDHTAIVDTVRIIQASALNILGIVPDSTAITFYTDLGYFQASESNAADLGNTITSITINGIATAFLNTGTQVGISSVTAEIDADGAGTMLTDSADLTILAGRPSQITLIPKNADDEIQSVIPVNSPENLFIWAYIFDSFGNPAGYDCDVTFECDLGSVTSPIPVSEDGIAVSTFLAGTQTGVAQITASVDLASAFTSINVISSEINSIQFVNQDQIVMYVHDNSYDIEVYLFDLNGDLIYDPREIWFKFLVLPEGCNLNSVVYDLADSTSAISSNGIASVTLNSGDTAGYVDIMAWCRTQTGEMIAAYNPNILVLAGAPAFCSISMGGIDSGESIGDGIWQVQIAAYITDAWDNPVAAGTAAYFYLDPEPDYASLIWADCYVGNENASGEIVEGTAFAYILYDGTYTNETVTLNVDVGGGVCYTENINLPLQFAGITMICTPAHVDWITPGDEEDKMTQCRVTVHDGQENPISNQRIFFTTSLGDPTDENIHPVLADITDPAILQAFNWDGINEDGDDDDGFTGWYEGDLGRLSKYVVFHKYECPPPLPVPPGMTTASITANIPETDISVTQTITLYRYTD